MIQHDPRPGRIVLFMWLLTVLISIFSGILSWNLVDPDSFWGGLLFLILWGILSKLGHFICFSFLIDIFRRW